MKCLLTIYKTEFKKRSVLFNGCVSYRYLDSACHPAMPKYLIGGIHVEFPKEAYPCQIQYMEHVIRALSSGTNALLESPTGTGKTLCLLCATLAWQESRKPKTMELEYSAGKSIDVGLGMKATVVPGGDKKGAPYTIVYATRTHSQLAQVVSELRETAYRPRMTVLGSREQLCVHEKVSKLKNGIINHACNSLNSKRGCMYRNNLDNYIESTSSMDNTSMMDIEEMVKLGNHRKICPYFHSREFCASSDLVLLPYNYLLDGAIRNTVKVDWSNAIIIFDEAHNLERVSADAASFSLSSTDLALCIQEMQQVLVTLRDEQQRTKAPSEAEALQKLIVSSVPAGSGPERPSLSAVVTLLKAMFELEKRIDGLQMQSSTIQQQTLTGLVYPGVWLSDLLKTVGFTDAMHLFELKKCCSMLMEMAQDTLGFDAAGASAAAVEPKLQAFTASLGRVLHSVKSRSCDDYKVYIADEVIKSAANVYGAADARPQKKRVINYWCFSTGVAMQELQQLGVKSLLLTSGTLSPMAALKEDIKLPFPIQLENPHVIGNNQMWVAALPVGVNGKQLNSTFQSRDTNAYKDELGQSVLQICNTMIGGAAPQSAPKAPQTGWAAYGVTAASTAPPTATAADPRVRGGVLIFFPSYAVMENVAARWRETGVYDKLRNSVGSVLMEPKGAGISPSAGPSSGGNSSNSGSHSGNYRAGKSGFHSGRDNAYSSANEGNFMLGNVQKSKSLNDDDEDGENSEAFRTIVGQFEHAIKVSGGCVLLAVCRGKVSEGIDFTDSKGRVVIITGIPYAPFMDPWVVLKKQYLDDKSSGKLAPSSSLAQAQAGTLGGSDPGVVLNLSAFQRPVVPSAYPVVMAGGLMGLGTGPGPGPPPPTAPYSLPNSNAAPPVPPAKPSGYGPYGSGIPPSSASHSVQNGSSVLAGAKKLPTSASLSGQGWYSQTAGRAVNQCIGRVIRHKKDWGTVFLLDDRFMQDRQIAQLSSWVKHRVKKYNTFSTALKEFRTFITTAALDTSLVSQAMAQRALQPAPDIERFRRREQSDKPAGGASVFARQIEIHESALADAGEDNTFINPSFLMTQAGDGGVGLDRPRTQQQPARSEAPPRDEEKELLSFFRRGASSSALSSTGTGNTASGSQSNPVGGAAESGKSSLLDAFSRSREKTSQPSAAQVTEEERSKSPFMAAAAAAAATVPLTISYASGLSTSTAASSNMMPPPSRNHTSTLSSNPPLSSKASFGLGSSSKPASFHVPEKIVRTKDSTIADYFAPPKPPPAAAQPVDKSSTQSSARPPASIARPPPVVKKSTLDIPKFSQSSSGSQLSQTQQSQSSSGSRGPSFLNYLSKLDDEMHSASDPVTDFHNQIGILKTLLPKDKILALKSKLMMAKGSEMRSLSQAKHFLDSLLVILEGVADTKVKRKALLSFAYMLPPELSDDYARLVTDTLDAVSTGSSKPKAIGLGLGKLMSKPSTNVGAAATPRDVSLSERQQGSAMDMKRKLAAEEDNYSYSQSQSSAYMTGTQEVKTESGLMRSAPSKRAKQLLNATMSSGAGVGARSVSGTASLVKAEGVSGGTQGNTTSSSAGGSKLSFLSKLSSLDNIALTGAVKTSNLADNRANRAGSAHLACTVCKEQPATDPCAARCGHVCCLVCWTKWLKVNQSCPQCRHPADSNSVTRILVKR